MPAKRTKSQPRCDRSFVDTKGRSWRFEIDGLSLVTVKEQCDYWLPTLIDKGIDIPTLVKVMGALLEDQLQASKIDEREFLRAFNEETFQLAGKALTRAVLSFSQPARRDALTKVLDRLEIREAEEMKTLGSKVAELTDAEIDAAIDSAMKGISPG